MNKNIKIQYPLVSVIILNYNGSDLLNICLKSLLFQNYSNIEIIVVDNGSTDNSMEIIKRYKDVVLLPLNKNYGFSIGNNIGASIAKGKYLFFINNDVRVSNTCIYELVNVMEKSEKIFASDTTQYDWDGEKVIHGETKIIKTHKFLKGVFPFVDIITLSQVNSSVVEVPYANGGSMMVRKDMFEFLGGFDEDFFLDFEDLDLCWRALMQGWKIVYVSSAIVYHKVGFSTKKLKKTSLRRVSYETNKLSFVIKTMSFKFILMHFIRHLILLFYYLFYKLNISETKVYFLSMFKVGVRILKLLRVRHRIFVKSKIYSNKLLKKFVIEGNYDFGNNTNF